MSDALEYGPDAGKLLELAQRSFDAGAYRRRYFAIEFIRWYPKQIEFFMLGASHMERLLQAANQCGKSQCAAGEVSYHLTGRYPSWWTGKRFDHAVTIVVASDTAVQTRDNMQRLLFGKAGVEEEFGTGTVPLECIVGKPSMQRGVTHAYDTVQVRHISGKVSTVIFRSYQSGREAFQGMSLHFVLLDEQPPIEVYAEARTRVSATNGIVALVFTPMLGVDSVVLRFLNEPSPHRAVIRMTLYDAKHWTPEMIEREIAEALPHQMRTRVFGEAMQGSGAEFTYPPETIMHEKRIEDMPAYVRWLWGFDFSHGGQSASAHPFAAVLACLDPMTGIIYVHHTVRMLGGLPQDHVMRVKAHPAWAAPVAWPHDGNAATLGGAGETIAKLYRNLGLNLRSMHTTLPDGGYGFEDGLLQMHVLFRTQRLLIHKDLRDLWDEYHALHRDDKGQIVKVRDDLLSALRQITMGIRFAQPLAELSAQGVPQKYQVIGFAPGSYPYPGISESSAASKEGYSAHEAAFWRDYHNR